MEGLKLGKTYEYTRFEGMRTGRFPFDCPCGIYAGKVKSGFLRFLWDGKDLLVNGGSFQEVRDERA